jgi:hypothetical protein
MGNGFLNGDVQPLFPDATDGNVGEFLHTQIVEISTHYPLNEFKSTVWPLNQTGIILLLWVCGHLTQ